MNVTGAAPTRRFGCGSPLVLLRLVEVDVERLGELVTDAWRMRAPDGLVQLVDDIEAQECFRGCGPRNC